MYCRGCRYDLRHLPESRCPECGRDFDPSDPLTFSTFQSGKVGAVAALFGLLDLPRWVRIVIASGLTIAFAVLGYPGVDHAIDCGQRGSIRAVNSRHLALTLMILHHEAPSSSFSPATIAQELAPSYSPVTEARKLALRKAWLEFTDWPDVQPLRPAAYCTLMIVVTRRWLRRAFVVGAIAFLLCAVAVKHRDEIAGWFWPPTLQYINDFALVPAPEWTSRDERTVVIAYEKRPDSSNHRYVVTTKGWNPWVTEPEFLALASEQRFDPWPP